MIIVHDTNVLPFEVYGVCWCWLDLKHKWVFLLLWCKILVLMWLYEHQVPFRGLCPTEHPSKPGNYEIKTWAACDAGPAVHGTCSCAMANRLSCSQDTRVVPNIAGFQKKTITCNSLFTVYAPWPATAERMLSMMGPVQRNKPELPPALGSNMDTPLSSWKFAFTQTHVLLPCQNIENCQAMSWNKVE